VLADAIAQQVILLSPSSTGSSNPEQAEFIKTQLAYLQDKITEAQDEISRLRLEMDAANSARQIQDLENQIAVLDTKISDWQNTYYQLMTTVEGGNINALSVVEEASIPTYPFSPNTRMNMLTAAAIGLVLALGGVFLFEYLNDTVKSPEDIERMTQLPVLGSVAYIEGEEYHDKLIAVKHPRSPVVEGFRLLRANLQFAAVDKPLKSLMITSAGPGEGKSVALANLAVVIGQAGQRVILVDSDLRRPALHRIFDLSNKVGLSDCFRGAGIHAAGLLQATTSENLWVMTSGELPPNPAELLGSKRMKSIAEELQNEADIVLYDCPPSLVVADAAILSNYTDGILLIVDTGRTRNSEIKKCVEELQRAHANLIGLVINRMSKRSSGYGYYYYEEGEKHQRRSQPGNWFERTLSGLRKGPKVKLGKTRAKKGLEAASPTETGTSSQEAVHNP
jgi:succinoglycan biosynthesis transport protein ExoP